MKRVVVVAAVILLIWVVQGFFTGPPCSRWGHLFDGRCDRLSLEPRDYPEEP